MVFTSFSLRTKDFPQAYNSEPALLVVISCSPVLARSWIACLHNSLFIIVIFAVVFAFSSSRFVEHGRRVQDDAVFVGGVIVAGLKIVSVA